MPSHRCVTGIPIVFEDWVVAMTNRRYPFLRISLVAALLLTRAMTRLLVGVTPTDPLTFAVMVVVFFVIAIVACYVPAHRAANVQPNVALRDG